MGSIFTTCTIFLHLLLLLLGMIHGNQGRGVAKGETPAAYAHMDLSWNILFHIQDLHLGNKLQLYFSVTNSSQTSHFIPKQEADSIPFSSSQTLKVLDFFSFAHDSPQAKAIKMTLNHCELPPLSGETKFCATSLESMLQKLTLLFAGGGNFRVLTTTHVRNWVPRLQKYTILEDPREIAVGKMFGCHPMPYPYAVYYCHSQETDNRLFMVSLEGEDGLMLEALAICHMDTSQWDPNHASFRVLDIEPGTAPVCHVFPQDNLVWASFPGSGD